MTSKFSIDNRELLQRISSGEAVVGIDFGNLIVRELAAFRLAAMDSEPVVECEKLAIENFRTAMEGIGHIRRTLDETFGGLHGTHVEPDVLAECKAICDAIYAAYRHAQPAPVVPDEIKRNPHSGWHVGPDGKNWSALEAAGWNKCRAAMLAAATQSPSGDHTTAPGKWIPVSERMPEDRTQVILWDAEIGEVTSGHYSHKTQTFYHCGDAIENEITHWMLPPSAPQGVKP